MHAVFSNARHVRLLLSKICLARSINTIRTMKFEQRNFAIAQREGNTRKAKITKEQQWHKEVKIKSKKGLENKTHRMQVM